jgi:hypothetical protein
MTPTAGSTVTRLSFDADGTVWELHPSGGKSYTGDLKKVDAQWTFESSDGSIRWTLGRNGRKAKHILRERYVPVECGCVSRV